MMAVNLTVVGLIAAAVLSLVFSTLTYSLREFSRPRLIEQLEKRGLQDRVDVTLDRISDFVFVTAFCRLFSNILVLVAVLHLLRLAGFGSAAQYGLAILVTGIITLFVSVAIPHALATHAAERLGAAPRPPSRRRGRRTRPSGSSPRRCRCSTGCGWRCCR